MSQQHNHLPIGQPSPFHSNLSIQQNNRPSTGADMRMPQHSTMYQLPHLLNPHFTQQQQTPILFPGDHTPRHSLTQLTALLSEADLRKTRATKDEICFRFLCDACPFGRNCHRVHVSGGRAAQIRQTMANQLSIQPSSTTISTLQLASIGSSFENTPQNSPPPIYVAVPASQALSFFMDVKRSSTGSSASQIQSDIKRDESWGADSESSNSVTSSPSRSAGRNNDSNFSSPPTSPDKFPGLPGRPVYEKGMCLDWMKNRCERLVCKFAHGPTNHDSHHQQRQHLEHPTQIPHRDDAASVDVSQAPERHSSQRTPYTALQMPQRSSELCLNALEGRCRLGDRCRYRHKDPLPLPDSTPLTEQKHTSTFTVRDHMIVKFGAGFEMKEVITAFEMPWISIDNVPPAVDREKFQQKLATFGTILTIRYPKMIMSNRMLVKVKFSTLAEAHKSLSLDGKVLFGAKLKAYTAFSGLTDSQAGIDACTVQLDFIYPAYRHAWIGYDTQQQAFNALEVIRRTPFRECMIQAEMDYGARRVGFHQVVLRHMPMGYEDEELRQWGPFGGTVRESEGTAVTIDECIEVIKKRISKAAKFKSFELQPVPHRNGRIRATLEFPDENAAKMIVDQLGGRQPRELKGNRIYLRHMKTITYHILPHIYENMAPDIQSLSDALKLNRDHNYTSIGVNREDMATTIISLSSANQGALGSLRREFEKLLHGEILYHDGRIVWHDWFTGPDGRVFLNDLQGRIKGSNVECLYRRRCFRLFGSSVVRGEIGRALVDQLKKIASVTVRLVAISGRLIATFINKELPALEAELGKGRIDIDVARRVLRVRGDNTVFDRVSKVVFGLHALHSNLRFRQDACPVCLSEVQSPVPLPCGHILCRGCLIGYLKSATQQRRFPLTCLGKEAQCTEPIPIGLARRLLSPDEFTQLVDASLVAHVTSRPDEFHFCPTPDCDQIYRTGAPDAPPLACPSCLTHICAACHVPYHTGFACADRDGTEHQFEEWVRANGAKRCPACEVVIEKAEGCNHVRCANCKVHICWVCMGTFKDADVLGGGGGDGSGKSVYEHMREVHGGIYTEEVRQQPPVPPNQPQTQPRQQQQQQQQQTRQQARGRGGVAVATATAATVAVAAAPVQVVAVAAPTPIPTPASAAPATTRTGGRRKQRSREQTQAQGQGQTEKLLSPPPPPPQALTPAAPAAPSAAAQTVSPKNDSPQATQKQDKRTGHRRGKKGGSG